MFTSTLQVPHATTKPPGLNIAMITRDTPNNKTDSPQTAITEPEIGRKTSFTSSTSSSGDETFSEHVQLVIEHAKHTIKRVKSQQSTQSLDGERNNTKKSAVSFDESDMIPVTAYPNQKMHPISPSEDTGACKPTTELHAIGKDGELVDTVENLIQLLGKSQEQVKQLKFKNFMLTAGLHDSDSRFEVEKNINKQQFERIKCQLILESQELLEKVRVQELKITKYKDKIIEKNKEINKLMRILNDSAVPNPYSSTSSPKSVTKPRLHRNEKNRKDSNMLTTLGILASHVLNEGNDTVNNIDNTESDISHDSVSNQNTVPNLPKAQHFVSMPVLPEARSSSLTPTSENSTSKQSFQLPKLRSFSTVDGTVKDPN